MATGKEKRTISRRKCAQKMFGYAAALTLTGCATPWFHKEKDPSEEYKKEIEDVKNLWRSEDRPNTIDQISRKVITLMRVENIGLVTELPGTGGKVEPSSQRDRMLGIMRRHDVPNPNQLLDDPSTAMVTAEVIVPPAARKRDKLNVLVSLSKHAEATSLQGGWLMNSELVEMSVLGGTIRDGFGFAMAKGPLVTKQQITGDPSPEAALKALVVGGAELLQSRNIGLAIEDKFAHAVTMNTILPPINQRFTVFDGANQVGVGKPRGDNYIELSVPPRYRQDPDHFANVIQHIGVAETKEKRLARLEQCSRELLEPTTARRAAYQLEAAGKDSVPMLLPALSNPDREVRFYAAHALAYLNDARCIPVLQELAVVEPAFRAMSLNGLMIVESYKANDSLQELLNAPDAETRYGALLALREHDSQLPIVNGEKAGQVGSILEIPSTGQPLIVVGLYQQPEIVIFGTNPNVAVSGFMYVNPRLIIRSHGPGRVTITHIAAGRDDRVQECGADLKGMLNAIAAVGGNYGDWVNFLRICGAERLFAADVAMNPVPVAGRKYSRDGFDMELSSDKKERISELSDIPVMTTEEPSDSDSSWINPFSWFGTKKKSSDE